MFDAANLQQFIRCSRLQSAEICESVRGQWRIDWALATVLALWLHGGADLNWRFLQRGVRPGLTGRMPPERRALGLVPEHRPFGIKRIACWIWKGQYADGW